MVGPEQVPREGLSDEQLHKVNPHELSLGFKSRHPGGAQFALADGSVHFVDDSIDFKLYNALGTRAGAEVAALP